MVLHPKPDWRPLLLGCPYLELRPRIAYKPYELELPNQFGLSTAYDLYWYGGVDAPCLLKGGDGGSNICGGLDEEMIEAYM